MRQQRGWAIAAGQLSAAKDRRRISTSIRASLLCWTVEDKDFDVLYRFADEDRKGLPRLAQGLAALNGSVNTGGTASYRHPAAMCPASHQ